MLANLQGEPAGPNAGAMMACFNKEYVAHKKPGFASKDNVSAKTEVMVPSTADAFQSHQSNSNGAEDIC